MEWYGEGFKSRSWSPGDSAAFAGHARRNESANCNPASRPSARGDGLLGDTPLFTHHQPPMDQSKAARRRPTGRHRDDGCGQAPVSTRQHHTLGRAASTTISAVGSTHPFPVDRNLPRKWTVWIDHPHRQAGLSDDFRIETTVCFHPNCGDGVAQRL